MTKTSNRERLEALLRLPEAQINLAEAALLLAEDFVDDLDVPYYLARLRALTDGARALCAPEATMGDRIEALNHYLFDEQGFRGNDENYYDPRNSLLSEVLERKRGQPITLSILYMEVGAHLGLDLQGVSFPGHFLVKLPLHGGSIVLDPYTGGVSLTEDELHALLGQLYGSRMPATPLARLLSAAAKRDILVRVLRNLKSGFVRQEDWEQALRVSQRILWLAPHLAEEWLQRGRLYERLECTTAAVADYRRYLELAPGAPPAEALRERLIELQGSLGSLH
ncbi:tetratricopeptide repeat protein [Ectothiorhodospiraceae bacterium 2226]|nr:tetratricopeptide repeat protein [Ectothiorhodospiraceae bacterium 2226]